MFLYRGYLPPSIMERSNSLGQIPMDAVVGTCVCSKGEPPVPSVHEGQCGDHWGRRPEEIRVYCFSFLLLFLQNSSPAVDFRTVNQAHYTNLINDETIALWRQKLSEHNNANTIKYVIAVCFHFASSKAHWNFLASWLIFFSAPTEVVNISGVLHLWNHSCKFIRGLISLTTPINIVICAPILAPQLDLLIARSLKSHGGRPGLVSLLRALCILLPIERVFFTLLSQGILNLLTLAVLSLTL